MPDLVFLSYFGGALDVVWVLAINVGVEYYFLRRRYDVTTKYYAFPEIAMNPPQLRQSHTKPSKLYPSRQRRRQRRRIYNYSTDLNHVEGWRWE